MLAVLTTRVAGAVFLFGIYLFVSPPLPSEQPSVTWALIFWIASSVIFGALMLFSRPVTFEMAFAGIVVSDCVSYGLLTAVFSVPFYDPFYVWYLAEAVFVATVYRSSRYAWVLEGLLVISYVISSAVAVPGATTTQVLFFLTGVVVLIGAPWLVSFTAGRQERRGAHLEAQQTEMIALNRRLERSLVELSALTEFTDVIHSTLDVESVGPLLLDIVQRITDIPAACMYVIDQKKQETIFSASKGLPAAYSGDVHALPRAGAETTDAEATFACIDVVEHSDMLVVFCADTEVIENLSDNNRVVLQAVASQLIVAVENSRLYKLTKRLAITDELTDLHNYRYLQQRLDEEIGRAKRYEKRLSFLMLDVDNFKDINDVYGHRVGDAVLGEIGKVLQATVREVDVVARYGGEEFSVILPETDASGAFIVAEKIREAISLHRFPDAEGNRRIHTTISIGLASYPTHAHDKESLLRAADDALYHAKTGGKDRVRAPRLRLRRTSADNAPMEVAE
jgi:diguanylate cyclase (GGDEF)-like protein